MSEVQAVSTVTIYWASADGERQGQKTLSGAQKQLLRDARAYECRLLNLGFYTVLEAPQEVLIHG